MTTTNLEAVTKKGEVFRILLSETGDFFVEGQDGTLYSVTVKSAGPPCIEMSAADASAMLGVSVDRPALIALHTTDDTPKTGATRKAEAEGAARKRVLVVAGLAPREGVVLSVFRGLYAPTLVDRTASFTPAEKAVINEALRTVYAMRPAALDLTPNGDGEATGTVTLGVLLSAVAQIEAEAAERNAAARAEGFADAADMAAFNERAFQQMHNA